MKGWKFSKVLCVLLTCLILLAMAVLMRGNRMPAAAKQEEPVQHGMDSVGYASDSGSTYLGTDHVAESGELSPGLNVEELLEEYSLGMNSVPGFPFRIDVADGMEYDPVLQSINVSVDRGELNQWNRETGIVVSKGRSDSVSRGETLYWSPLDGQTPMEISKATISIEATFDNTVIGRQQIHLIRDESGNYHAKVEKSEPA